MSYTGLQRLLGALLVLVVQSAAAYDAQWPQLAGKVGPYSGIVTSGDAVAAAGAGFNVTVQSAYDPGVLGKMASLGIRHIDIQLWGLVYAQCKRQFDAEAAAGQRRACALSDSMRDAIMRDAEAHLRAVETDENVVGYWTLDDYPAGDVSQVLVELRGLVKQSGARTGVIKPTICGIGGSLDHRSESDARMKPDRVYIDASLQNITPAACDIVAPYFYGAATRNDATWVDWTMRDLMPWFQRRLNQRGFAHPVLLPVVQAFYADKRGGSTYFVQPRAEDIEAQARTYCRAGALSMMFFTWQAAEAKRSYVNDADIRRGVGLAVAQCRAAHLGG